MKNNKRVEREARKCGKMVWPWVAWDHLNKTDRDKLIRLARHVLRRVDRAKSQESKLWLGALANRRKRGLR
jgi:hypothetical protein